MLPNSKGHLRNEDDAYRTRKRIHESGINEAFEAQNSFCEFEDNCSLTFWHKFKIAELFPAPPASCQLVEADTPPSEEAEQDVSLSFEKFAMGSSVRLTDAIELRVSYAADPIRSQIRKTFPLKIEFRLIYKTQEIVQELFNKKIGIQSKIWLKLDNSFTSRRKVGIAINENSSQLIVCNSSIQYQEDEELVNELQIDLSDILIDEDDDNTPNGLVNLGVTCYMNSYLQTIFHLKKFRYFVNRLDNEQSPASFVFSLQSLFYKLEKMRNSSPSPQHLVSSFGWNVQQIFTQQDVQEFSFMFLDAIEKKCQKFGMEELINKELFQGISESFIKCKDIEYESKREEVFADVQLAIKDTKNLEEAIENYLAIEELIGDNAYDTEKFGKRDAIKGVRFKKLPKVLIFHLSRFEYDYRFDENMKVLTEFVYPEYIDMDPYVGERQLEKVRRKSSVIPDINELSQNRLENGISIINGNGNINGNGHCHVFQEEDLRFQSEPPTLSQVNNSENGYILFGVFVHFGQNAYSGHYEVYLKIDDQWYEFNDDAVQKVDFEEVKRQSFGGKKKIHMFDSKSFKLKEKVRDTDGHAYMLVYIRAKDYDEIVRNNDQEVPYPDNVIEFSNTELLQLEKDQLRRTYYKVYLLRPETFLNHPTGRGVFFYTVCNFDHLKNKRFKKFGNYSKFMIKRSATTSEVIAKITADVHIAADDEVFLFLYNEKRDEFCFLDPGQMFPSFNGNYHQHIYIHIEKKLPEDSEVQYVPAFTVFKKWNPEAKSFFTSHIKMLKTNDTMVGIQAFIREMENDQDVQVFFEDLKERRMDPIEEPRSIRPLFDLLQIRHQSSINFVYRVIPPESNADELKSEMVTAFRVYMATFELSLQDRATDALYHLICRPDMSTMDVFQFIRKTLDIENDPSLTIDLHIVRNNHMLTVPETRNPIALFNLTKNLDMTFEVKQVVAEPEEDPSAKNIRIRYHGYCGRSLNVSEHFDFEKFNGDTPSREQIYQELKYMPELITEMSNDLQPIFEGDSTLRFEDFVLYEKTERGFRPMTPHAYLNYFYFVVPVLAIECPGQTDSSATHDDEQEADKETEQEEPSSNNVKIEFRINSKAGHLMLAPIIFSASSSIKNADLFKVLEGFVCKLSIQNPENADQLEPEYIRRNLKIFASMEGREFDMEKFSDSRVCEFDSQVVQITAVISMDSFRNNIKINI
jgi:ubiquitin C-terminal hydrolase